jgi:hypothetical protein
MTKKRHTDAQVINFALETLVTGLLPSALPPKLMEEFRITRERTRRLVGEALPRWKAESADDAH